MIDGACDGFMWGGIGALGTSVASAAPKIAKAAKAAKIVTVKQYGERVFMPGKLAGTIGEKALAENSRAYYQNALDRHIYPIIGERKMQEVTAGRIEQWKSRINNIGSLCHLAADV